jgi:hypothetical protein
VIAFEPFAKLVDWFEAEASIVEERTQESALAGVR